MNQNDDKNVVRERRYLFFVPEMFLIGFGVTLLGVLTGLYQEIDIFGHSGVFVNVLGAIIDGYILSCECTIIHFMLNRIRTGEGFIKALLIVLFIPSLLAGVLISAIITIPYYYKRLQNLSRIKADDQGILLKRHKTALIVSGIADIIILIIYFLLYK